MLTAAEATKERDSLRATYAVVVEEKIRCLAIGSTEGVKILNDAAGLLIEEIAWLSEIVDGEKTGH